MIKGELGYDFIKLELESMQELAELVKRMNHVDKVKIYVKARRLHAKYEHKLIINEMGRRK